MSGIAKIYKTTLDPTKEAVARAWVGDVKLVGSYRLVDTVDDATGIEVLIASDPDGRLVQIPFTYRSQEINPEQTLTTIEHGVLGTRWVTNALGDPVAVREFIRTILTGDHGATRDDGVEAYLDVHGTGSEKDLQLNDVRLSEITRQRAVGTVDINGHRRQFMLRLPHVLAGFKNTGRGHNATALRLVAPSPQHRDRELLVAEFNWLE
ncbi:CG0192 family protein [Corynebacterium pacaense]|uniref:CG0192 family protein n=1 Tax=Corynebacterium pacaense TaxID=1816684 RepID=UPI0009BA233F|nr:hypothetical protein [Corynebacterium pacaense]